LPAAFFWSILATDHSKAFEPDRLSSHLLSSRLENCEQRSQFEHSGSMNGTDIGESCHFVHLIDCKSDVSQLCHPYFEIIAVEVDD
jgi:hypothetical protein